ncbi:hypothetical protein [Pseudomonas indica]|uniref:hypothetical protein n=1 Tax=Pseudomonas indica TaxID=137658 RepID=UPI003FD11B74
MVQVMVMAKVEMTLDEQALRQIVVEWAMARFGLADHRAIDICGEVIESGDDYVIPRFELKVKLSGVHIHDLTARSVSAGEVVA